MNCKAFYEDVFNPSIKFLGLSWAEKDKVEIFVSGQQIVFRFRKAEVRYDLKNTFTIGEDGVQIQS